MMEKIRGFWNKIVYLWNYYGPVEEDTDWEPVWE